MKVSSWLLVLLASPVFGQAIRYPSELRDTAYRQYSLQYENDLFTHTDRYYTQGIALAYHRKLSGKTGFDHLFFNLPNAKRAIGTGIDQQAFTPTTIHSDSLLKGDRPYAATFRLNGVFETEDTIRHRSLAWSISLGIIGPQALEKETQTGIHKATNNFLPLGWQHQLNTGLLADLGMQAQQQVIAFGHWFTLDATATGNLGLARTDLSLGGNLGIHASKKKMGITAYTRPAIRLVGYDGTLQGSLISRSSEYRITASQLRHTVSEQEIGIRISVRALSIEAWYRFQSGVFEGAMNHRWGGLKISVRLN